MSRVYDPNFDEGHVAHPAELALSCRSLPTPSVLPMPSEEEIYQEHILDHYEDPFHNGPLAGETHAHEDKNPLCGDVIRVALKLDADGKVEDCAYEGDGCVISQASASMLLEALHGKTVEEVKAFSAEDMLKLYGPRLTPNRQKCCLLSWRVIQQAVFSPVS